MSGAIERLADAMEAESIYQIRDWRPTGKDYAFSIELKNGNRGYGKTPREAIEDAKGKQNG